MNPIIRPLRGLLIALAVLALSTGVVLGAKAMPQAAFDGSARASEASGQTVPLRTEADEDENETPDVDEDTDEDQNEIDEDQNEAPEVDEDADESQDAEAPNPDADVTTATDNHGVLVSAAATMDAPAGFDNHGAFVSCVARMNHGHDTGAPALTPADLATLTPADCVATTGAPVATAATTHGNSDKAKTHLHGKSGGHGHRHAK